MPKRTVKTADKTTERITFKLLYHGRDVDDGTMAINEVTEVLEGFSGAYTKVGAFLNSPDLNLRVSAPKKGSFEIAVFAAMLAQHETQFHTMEQAWDWAKRIFNIVKEVMELKKQTKAQPFTIEVGGHNNVVNIITADKVVVPITREALEIHQKKIIDRDVEKIVDPLRPKRIDSAELALGDHVELTVTAEERKYFQPDIVVFTEKPDDAIGTILSLSKQTNRGTFEMQNGAHVSYHYAGDDKYKFYTDFSYKGVVRVSGTIDFDGNNTPIHIEINSVERLQTEMFPDL